MKKATKILLIIAACLVFVGASAFCITMAANDWDFGKVGSSTETAVHDINDEFQNISIDSSTADIEFIPSTDGSCRVVCKEREKEKHEVSVKDGTLRIERADQREWYDHIMLFSVESLQIKVYLPEGEYGSLFIDESTGSVKIPKGFSFADASLSLSTGDVDFGASVSGKLHIDSSTGDLKVEGMTAGEIEMSVSTGRIDVTDVDCKGDLRLSGRTGRTYLTDVTCRGITSEASTGDIKLTNVVASGLIDVDRSTGDVYFEGCDAQELDIETDTGDVEGSLLSDKIFFARSDTGHIEVPETTSGGKCKITSDTGDIRFTTGR